MLLAFVGDSKTSSELCDFGHNLATIRPTLGEREHPHVAQFVRDEVSA
jgi:hypothetical protein